MHKYPTVRCLIGIVAAGASALWVAAGGSAAAQTMKPDVSVAIFAEHYALAGRLIDDLDVLETAVSAMRPRAVRLDACGTGADRAQRAAAHRFRNLYLELRVLEPDAPGCLSAVLPRAMPVTQRLGQRPFGIDDESVDRWWHELIP